MPASTRGDLLARCGAGLVAWFVPPGLVREVAEEARAESDAAVLAAGGTPARQRARLLPPAFGIYVVLGLCLFSHLPYRAVAGGLVRGMLEPLEAAGWGLPSRTALTGLRRRLGSRPFELLFARVAGIVAAGRTPGSHLGGLLLVAWDGTEFKVRGSEANRGWFGWQQDGLPKARLVALVACATRAVIGAAPGPMTTGERKLAGQLTGHLRKGMLLLADRGFYCWDLWNACASTGAHLLWRVPASMHLPAARVLPDGSYLAVIHDPAERRKRSAKNAARRRRKSPLPPDTSPLPGQKTTVRVIEFTITVTPGQGQSRTEPYRMITTVLDWRAFPAGDLAAAYARRWSIEGAKPDCLHKRARWSLPVLPSVSDLVLAS